MSTYTIELTQETSDALTQAAADRSASFEDLIASATEQFLAEQSAEYEWSAEDAAAIEEGIAQLDRGEGVPHDAVIAAMRANHGGCNPMVAPRPQRIRSLFGMNRRARSPVALRIGQEIDAWIRRLAARPATGAPSSRWPGCRKRNWAKRHKFVLYRELDQAIEIVAFRDARQNNVNLRLTQI